MSVRSKFEVALPFNVKEGLQFLSSFVVFLNTWGLLLAFGVLQTYYSSELLLGYSDSDIAWIATICVFLTDGTGIVSGPLFDRGYYRFLILAGTCVQVFGLMLLSLCTQYYQVFLTHGVCVGLGMGLLYTPSVAAISVTFKDKKRILFIGLISSASGIGGVIYPIVFRKLLVSVGFAWAIRVMGFVVLATYLLAWPILLYNSNATQAPRRTIQVNITAFNTALTDTPFAFAALGQAFYSVAYYLPSLYLPLFARTTLATTSLDSSLVAICNGSSIFGRCFAGIIARRLGPIETCIIAILASGILLFAWASVDTTLGIIIWSVLWGGISSVIIALPGAMVPLLSPSLDVVGVRTGIFELGAAGGSLIGGPIGGALLRNGPWGLAWWHLTVFSGAMMLGAALCTVPSISRFRSAFNAR